VTIWRYLIEGPWIVFIVYWIISALKTRRTASKEPFASRLSFLVWELAGYLLLFDGSLRVGFLGERMIPRTWALAGAGVAFVWIGIGLAIWARRHLGEYWSARVTIKEDHELITGGPYRMVRHPIYTGLLLAFVGLALARGEWRSILGVVIAAGAFWRKLRIEERWMRQRFGDSYQTYSQRVAALIPFVI